MQATSSKAQLDLVLKMVDPTGKKMTVTIPAPSGALDGDEEGEEEEEEGEEEEQEEQEEQEEEQEEEEEEAGEEGDL